jgi:sarcosine oxidase, subunit gamma
MAETAIAGARRRSPFEHLADRFRQRTEAAGGAVSLRELPFCAQISLRGNAYDPAFRKAVNKALGFDIPVKPNRNIVSSGVTALWLGPDEWLLVGTQGTEETVISRLRTALAGLHASVVDVSDARGILDISGPRSRDLLAKGCSLDLHPRAFHQGDCVQTNLARANIILEMRDTAPTWLVYVRISFADYLATWLLDATTEFCVRKPHP